MRETSRYMARVLGYEFYESVGWPVIEIRYEDLRDNRVSFWCPFCGDQHWHSADPDHGMEAGEGHRCAHCPTGTRPREGGYVLRYQPWPDGERRHEPVTDFVSPSAESHGRSMRPYVKLYKEGDQLAISTNVANEEEFITLTADALTKLIDESQMAGEWDYHFRRWLPQVVDICCKLRGYKAPLVDEQRVLTAGVIAPRESALVIESDNGGTSLGGGGDGWRAVLKNTREEVAAVS